MVEYIPQVQKYTDVDYAFCISYLNVLARMDNKF